MKNRIQRGQTPAEQIVNPIPNRMQQAKVKQPAKGANPDLER